MNYVECVPNYSEGKDRKKVEAIIDEIRKYPVEVLDVEMNSDHNRSVVTVVGEGENVLQGVFASIRKAAELIDLDINKGEHPRFGATDVVPFVPILGTSVEYCVELARKLGEKVGKELGIPVYMYGLAANLPSRKSLPDIRNRNFQYEQLKDAIAKEESYRPDFGPASVGHSGATIIGAREFLIAFNVDMKSEDLKSAKEIARRTRGKTGGFKNVQALGFNLSETKETQVSMNLVNFRETQIPQVFEFVKREAEARGLSVSRSELVGMVPIEALEEIYRFYLNNREFSKDQIIEKKLLDIFIKDGLKNYLGELSSEKPAPGGGSASGIVGAIGSALISMVASLTIGKKKYEDMQQKMIEMRDEAKRVMWVLYRQADKDTQAFNNLSDALALPKDTPEEKESRTRKVQEMLKEATMVPYETGKTASTVLDYLPVLKERGNRNATSDVYCASFFLTSCIKGSMQNVRINLDLIKDEEFVKEYKAKMFELLEMTEKKNESLTEGIWKFKNEVI